VFEKLFKFQMSSSSKLQLPTLDLEKYDDKSVTVRLTGPNPYLYEDVKNQVMQLKLEDGYDIFSVESPRVKLKEQVIELPLDQFKEYELDQRVQGEPKLRSLLHLQIWHLGRP